MNSETREIPQKPFAFLFYSTRSHKLVATLAMLFVLAASASSTLVPYVFKRIVDTINGLPGIGPENVWFWATLYVISAFFSAMCWRGSGFAGLRWATGVRATGRVGLTEHITQHSYGFFSSRFAGALASKLRTSTEGVKTMVESILWEWLEFGFKIFFSMVLMFVTNVYIGAVFVLWFLIVVPANFFLARKKVALSMATQAADTELTAHTVDVLTNIAAMHDYARRSFELDNLNKLIEKRRRAGARNWTFSERILTLNSIIEAIFTALLIFGTVYAWTRHVVTAGDILLVLSLVLSIRSELAHLGNKLNNFAETIGQIKEGLTDILHPHEIVDDPQVSELSVSSGEILFKNVSFKYGKRDIFSNLDLQISGGQRVGLVGRSGAGKSTLMKLLTRQYDISEGEILIDGQDIRSVKQESLRDEVAIVPQDPALFHRSLKDNIKYGKLSATDEEIVAAAEHAQAHSFISTLQHGYDTLVGERGVKLSGGERQRVAIARAFLKNAKILLLDEATSSLDSESELMIRKALEELMKGKTVIAIAHRLSTLRAMDRILVLDGGKIVEDGTHEELLEAGGKYAELWAHQAGGFLKEE